MLLDGTHHDVALGLDTDEHGIDLQLAATLMDLISLTVVLMVDFFSSDPLVDAHYDKQACFRKANRGVSLAHYFVNQGSFLDFALVPGSKSRTSGMVSFGLVIAVNIIAAILFFKYVLLQRTVLANIHGSFQPEKSE
ncbi:hypothetical protein C0991_004795 [Blastosporella zonata]|nr:hypothetical protein C0991_004795 [Blastosporella zonata]